MFKSVRLTLFHLNLIDGVGPVTIKRLYDSLGADLPRLYELSAHDISTRSGLSLKMSMRVTDGLKHSSLYENELERVEKHGIEWLSIDDIHYPELLKHIHVPPVILYYRGDITSVARASSRCLAAVGSRRGDEYAQYIVNMLLKPLCKYDVTLISGGAHGVDTMVHKAAVSSVGKTVAVLGSGLCVPYPPENDRLFKQIVANGGAVISSFPVNTKPQPGNFPARNRIIAGLAPVCIVVQAAQKSGALITARFALDEGREVCAIPGPIDHPLSEGCHQLIRQGAHIITSIDDLILLLGIDVNSIQSSVSKQNGQTVDQEILVRCTRPVSFEALAWQLSLEEPALRNLLFELQIEGKVDQDVLGRWYRT